MKSALDLDKCSGRAEGEITFSLKENDSLPAHVSGEFLADLNFNEFGFLGNKEAKVSGNRGL
ncbi:MAG: hypothetical protein R2942_16300 [Ignavibacteria bacterium]